MIEQSPTNANAARAVYWWRRDKIFVLSVWARPPGWFTQDDPVVANVDDPEMIGAAIQNQLRAFRDVPWIEAGWQLQKPSWKNLCAAAGVKSHSTFTRNAALGGVRSDSGLLTFYYQRKLSRGWESDSDSGKSIASDCSNSVVGKVALAVLTESDEA